eukprot:EG_transcript_8329
MADTSPALGPVPDSAAPLVPDVSLTSPVAEPTAALPSKRRAKPEALKWSKSPARQDGGGIGTPGIPVTFPHDSRPWTSDTPNSTVSRDGSLGERHPSLISSSSMGQFSPNTGASSNSPSTVSHTSSPAEATEEWHDAGLTDDGKPILSLKDPQTHLKFRDFRRSRRLGQGASGSVFKVKDPEKRPYAEKVILLDPNTREQISAELAALRKLHECSHIVRYHNAFLVGGEMHIVMDYMNVGSLQDLIEKLPDERIIPNEPLKCILHQVLLGLDFLHATQSQGRRRPQIHRDIKPANILLNTHGQVKLSDFGCLKQSNNTIGAADTFLGTKVYMSPERLRGEKYTVSADVFSVGVVAFECATGRSPFAHQGVFDLLNAMENVVPIPSNVDPQLGDFITKCLLPNPAGRPSASSLLTFPFVHVPDHRAPLKQWLQEVKDVVVQKSRKKDAR